MSADFRENGTTNDGLVDEFGDYTWWLIPVSKWIITPVISELTLLSPVRTRGITYLLSRGEPPSSGLLNMALTWHSVLLGCVEAGT